MGILPLAFGHVIINGTLQKSGVLLVPGGASHQHWRPSEQDPLLLAFRLFPPGGWAPKGHFNHLQSTCFFFQGTCMDPMDPRLDTSNQNMWVKILVSCSEFTSK